MKLSASLCLGFLLLPLPVLVAATQEDGPAPRLVLQITVDQLRGDMPRRMHSRFGAGGFRYLMDAGADYLAADYAHATTMTAPGHAALFTGANPRENGIVANDWFDQESGRVVYNCEDLEHAILGQDPRLGVGSSPKLLKGSTIGDELLLASGGRSKVFAVSVKDRGAILPGGHLGKAFWFSSANGQFVTSDYYYPEYPAWVAEWNAKGLAKSYLGTQWELMGDPASYLFEDDRPYERGTGKLGNTFPKAYEQTANPTFFKSLAYTPAGDELLASFAEALIDEHGMGQGAATDFLAISFSSTDYVGHVWGPSSVEAEDNLLRLDRTLAGLLKFVDERVGLDKTLVVLSADHGAPNAPEALAALGRKVGWVDDLAMLKAGNRALKEHFGIEQSLIRAHVAPYVYLDHGKLAELGLDLEEVKRVLIASLEAQPGVARAVPRKLLAANTPATSPLMGRLQASFDPARSGDLWIVPEPQWLIGSGNPRRFLTSIHGTPWSYDTHVPILLAGPGIVLGQYTRPVSPRDIAPTLAVVLGIKAPEVATGRVLFEALGR